MKFPLSYCWDFYFVFLSFRVIFDCDSCDVICCCISEAVIDRSYFPQSLVLQLESLKVTLPADVEEALVQSKEKDVITLHLPTE